MPKTKTADRLAQAITKTKTNLEEYIKKIALSKIRNGFCVIMPTHAGSPILTHERVEGIKKTVLEVYKDENLFGFAIQYFNPPLIALPPLKPEGDSDYEIRAGIVEFDENWQIDQFAKGFLYCPSEREMEVWNSRYDKLSQGLRFTPLMDMALKESQARQFVNGFLYHPAEQFFRAFAEDYAKEDLHVPKINRNQDIRTLYHEISDFPVKGAPIFHAYAQARIISRKTRNHKIQHLMNAFIKCIEQHCLKLSTEIGAASATQNAILDELRRDSKNCKQSYRAERPAQSLFYFRTAQILTLFVSEFLEAPVKHLASGEIAMFIWLAQHISFEGPAGVQINDLLSLQVTDFDLKNNTLMINNKKVLLTEGIADLIQAWLGKASRTNARWLFRELKTSKFLTDNLARMSAKLPQFKGEILGKDLLLKPHVVGHDASVDRHFLGHLDWQAGFASKSPYTDTINLSKQIREKILSIIS